MKKLIQLLIAVLLTQGLQAQGFDSLNVSLLFHWSDSTIPPAVIHANAYNEVWGYARDGREYGIIGTSLGTHFFDVTDPVNSLEVAFIQGQVSSSQIIHRDMKTYADHLFIVADEGQSTMQVVDLQYLPDSVVTVYDDDALLFRAHNVFIDTVHGRLYTCGGNTNFSVYDITTPDNPSLLMDCAADLPWWNGSVGYVHDAYINDHIAYLNAADEFYVIDFSDLNNVSILGSLDNYPDQGYNHSGWLNDAGTHYTMCDETHGMQIKLLDVTDLNDIQVTALFTSGVDANSIVHNVVYRGDMLHASYYHDGYYLWDHTDKTNPVLLGYYDTSEEVHNTNFKGNWGVYPLLPSGIVLASDMQEGFFVLDVSQALSVSEQNTVPQIMRVWPNPGSGSLSIHVPNSRNGKLLVEFFNAKGALVLRQNLDHSTMTGGSIDINSFAEGLYQIRANDGLSTWNTSFVKE